MKKSQNVLCRLVASGILSPIYNKSQLYIWKRYDRNHDFALSFTRNLKTYNSTFLHSLRFASERKWSNKANIYSKQYGFIWSIHKIFVLVMQFLRNRLWLTSKTKDFRKCAWPSYAISDFKFTIYSYYYLVPPIFLLIIIMLTLLLLFNTSTHL